MYKVNIGESEYEIVPEKGQGLQGKINAKDYSLDLTEDASKFHLLKDHKSYNISIVDADYESRSFKIMVNSRVYELEAKDRFDLLLEELGMEDLAAGSVNDLKAPMPGLVLNVQVNEGDEVKKGDSLVVLEAMKMENVLKAESDAVVKAINVDQGQAVEKNFVLVEFEAQG